MVLQFLDSRIEQQTLTVPWASLVKGYSGLLEEGEGSAHGNAAPSSF